MSNAPVYTLVTLNLLRTKAGMAPLKAWKESKAKLEVAIGKLLLATKADPTAKELKATEVAKAAKKPAKEPKKIKDGMAAVAKAKSAKEKKTPVDGVSISTIAAELDMDPKVARAKLRRAFGDADSTGSNGRWVFTDAKIKEIKAILTGDARKKKGE
jgi:hypothetical protein